MKKLCEKNKKLVLAASAVSLGMLAGGVALMNHGYIASAESAFPGDGTIQVLDGTSLKLNAGGGLRFIVKMNAAAKNYIKDADANDEVKLVVRVGAVKYFGEKWLNCEVDEEKLYRVDGDEAWYANVCLTNVREQNRKLDYTAQAYIYSGKTEAKVSDYNKNARGNFYDVATAALLDTKQDYTQQILSLENYSWLGADETFPLYIDSLDLYNGLVTKINEGADFSKKYVAVRSNVDVKNGTALNEGKQLPENNYKLSLVTFKDGEKELGSVMVKNDGAATFETPADRIDGNDKLVFEKWVTENGGDAEADLSAISGDAVVYAKFRRVFANAITAFNTADIVYGETPAFTATAKYGEAGITFAKEKDGEYKAWGELENHNVGTYYVKASVAATSGYSAAEETKSFEVKKATNAMQLKMAATIKCTDTPEPAATALHGEGDPQDRTGASLRRCHRNAADESAVRGAHRLLPAGDVSGPHGHHPDPSSAVLPGGRHPPHGGTAPPAGGPQPLSRQRLHPSAGGEGSDPPAGGALSRHQTEAFRQSPALSSLRLESGAAGALTDGFRFYLAGNM